MAKTNEQEEKSKVKVDTKTNHDHEMNRSQKAGARSPMYGGPRMTPGNKRAPIKKRY